MLGHFSNPGLTQGSHRRMEREADSRNIAKIIRAL